MPNAAHRPAREDRGRVRPDPKRDRQSSPTVASIVVSESPTTRSLLQARGAPASEDPRKTIRYECVGGPRDGDVVLIQRTKHQVRLDGALYEVRLWAKMDEHGQRLLWKREALVWEGLLVSDSPDQPTPNPLRHNRLTGLRGLARLRIRSPVPHGKHLSRRSVRVRLRSPTTQSFPTSDSWRDGREAEGTGLLNRHRG